MKTATIKIIITMVLFGTIGLFVRYIDFGSGFISGFRGYTGAIFLLVVKLFKKSPKKEKSRPKDIILLILSGVFIGFNWIFLFEAYNYTTIATATLCYYMAPAFVIILAAFVLREKITIKKAACLIISLAGAVLVSGVFDTTGGMNGYKGIIFGLCAAVLYASDIICNKKVSSVTPIDRTIIQLLSAAITVTPYTLIQEGIPDFGATDTRSIICLVTLGIVHTGLAYFLYFGGLEKLPANKVALMSYIDPVVAILLGTLFLSEPMTLLSGIGAVLIIASALWSSLEKSQKYRH